MSAPRPLLFLALLLALLTLSGCSTVLSQAPVGAEADAEAARDLSGEWKAEKGKVRFSDAGDGHITVHILPAKEGRAAPRPFDVALRRSGDQRYAVLKDPDDPDAPGFLFLRYRLNENRHIVGWIPNTQAFRDAIADGRLAGELQGSRVSRTLLITASPEEFDAFVTSLPEDELWETNHPVVIWNPDAPDTPK